MLNKSYSDKPSCSEANEYNTSLISKDIFCPALLPIPWILCSFCYIFFEVSEASQEVKDDLFGPFRAENSTMTYS